MSTGKEDENAAKPNDKDEKGTSHHLIKFILELGPLLVFFYANSKFDFFTATASFMAAITLSLIFSYVLLKRLPIMPLLSAIFIFVFGGLTLYLQDSTFFKIKPTIINSFLGWFCWQDLSSNSKLWNIFLVKLLSLPKEGGKSSLNDGVSSFSFWLASMKLSGEHKLKTFGLPSRSGGSCH